MSFKPLSRLFFVALLALGTALSTAQAEITPMAQVKATVDRVVIILRDDAVDWNSKETMVREIVREGFDFRSMSQSVLATNWQSATPAERERFVDYFSQHLMGTYLEKIHSSTDPYHIRYKGEKVKGQRAVVDTTVVSKGVDIPVTYKLKENGGRWYTYDVVIEGRSLVKSYRDVYGALVKDEGMSGLLDSLQISLDKYKGGKGR